MNRMSTRRTVPLVVLVCALVAASVVNAAPLRIVVSIPPQVWFVQQMVGDGADVSVLLGPGDSPATYEPTPRQMAALEGADLFLAAGVPFERAVRPRIVGLADAPRVVGPVAAGGGHAGHHGHDHGDGLDPHRWLSAAGAGAIGDTLVAALTTLRPGSARQWEAARADLATRIAEVDSRVRAVLAGHRGGIFLVFHPAFGHFADAYGLEQVAIEDDGHEPGARHLAEVTSLARRRHVGAVVVQSQFSRRAAEAVASSLGVPVVDLDPLAPDWDANLVRIAMTLAEVLGTGKEKP